MPRPPRPPKALPERGLWENPVDGGGDKAAKETQLAQGARKRAPWRSELDVLRVLTKPVRSAINEDVVQGVELAITLTPGVREIRNVFQDDGEFATTIGEISVGNDLNLGRKIGVEIRRENGLHGKPPTNRRAMRPVRGGMARDWVGELEALHARCSVLGTDF